MNKFKVGDRVVSERECVYYFEGVATVEWSGEGKHTPHALVRTNDGLLLMPEFGLKPYVVSLVRCHQMVISKVTKEPFRVAEIHLSGRFFRLNRMDGTEVGGWQHIDSYDVTPWIVDSVRDDKN